MEQIAIKSSKKESESQPTHEQAEAAVRTLLAWAGDDPQREGLRATPQYVLAAYKEFFAGYHINPDELLHDTVEETNGYDEIVLLKDIPLQSHCEHHMVPIIGVAHVAYLPNKRTVGIGNLARVVDAYAKRLQIQERMTLQIAHTIERVLQPQGVAVIITADQHCLTTRGIRKENTKTITSCMLGRFRDDPKTRAEFLSFVT